MAKVKVEKTRSVIHYHDTYAWNETLPPWNLICSSGHLSFAPEPMTWVGHECGNKLYNKATKRRTTCHKKQMLLKDYKPERVPKPKKKIKRKRKVVSRY